MFSQPKTQATCELYHWFLSACQPLGSGLGNQGYKIIKTWFLSSGSLEASCGEGVTTMQCGQMHKQSHQKVSR